MDIDCPECGWITPTKGEISSPSFRPEEKYLYTEYTCPNCKTIVFTTRELKRETGVSN